MKLATRTQTIKIIEHSKTGELVRQRRRSSKVSLRELARRVGLSAPYLSDLEKGRRNWSEELFNRITKQLS